MVYEISNPGGRLCGFTGGERKRFLSFLLEVSGKLIVFLKI
jgi:hypothetical protein